jgi:hypothetical protein
MILSSTSIFAFSSAKNMSSGIFGVKGQYLATAL